MTRDLVGWYAVYVARVAGDEAKELGKNFSIKAFTLDERDWIGTTIQATTKEWQNTLGF